MARRYGRCTRFESEKGLSQVKILTNSRESTDLNVVNVYTDAWLKPVLEADKKVSHFIDYREYKATGRSLHAKVMIFGNDVFVGSANADGRSQYMDANNGIFIRNAPKLAAAYKAWLAKEIAPSLVVAKEDPRNLRSTDHTIAQVAKENITFLGGVLKARGHEDLMPYVEKRIAADSTSIYSTAGKCFDAYDKACIVGLDKLLQPL